MHHSDHLMRELVEAGVRGYVMKSDSNRDLIVAVESLANHKPFFTPKITEMILGRFSSGRSVEVLEVIHERLTSREREIVQLLAEGKSAKVIAQPSGAASKPSKHIARIL
jgi:DNA-binding NarL/FixJ family response regulator